VQDHLDAILLFVLPSFTIQDSYTVAFSAEVEETAGQLEEEPGNPEGEINNLGGETDGFKEDGEKTKEPKKGGFKLRKTTKKLASNLTKKFVAKFQKVQFLSSSVVATFWLIRKIWGIHSRYKEISKLSDEYSVNQALGDVGMLLLTTCVVVTISTIAGYGLDSWHQGGPALSEDKIIAWKVALSAVTGALAYLQLLFSSLSFSHPVDYSGNELE